MPEKVQYAERLGQATSLYHLASAVQEVEARVRDGEELTPELEAQFDKAHGDLEAKVRAVGARYWKAVNELEEQTRILAMVQERVARAKRVTQGFSRYIGTQLARANRTVDGAVDGVPITWGSKERTETVVPKAYYENPQGLPPACYSPLEGYSIDRRLLRQLMDADPKLKLPDGVKVRRWHEVKVT